MASSILIPSVVAEKTSKRLGKLASTAGVEFAKVPGETTIFRRAYESYYRRNHATGKVEIYKRLAVDVNQALTCERFTIGELPRFNGHTFIGKVTHTSAGNMLALARQFADRGDSLPFDWRNAKATCDHCNTVRARKETFLLQTEDGKIVRVGRNCLADFLMSSPEQLIALSVFQDVLRECSGEGDEDREGGGWSGWHYSPLHFLACAASATDRIGFINREQADIRMMQSTRDTAAWLADSGNKDRGRDSDRQAWRDGQPTVEHWAQAVACLVWLEAQDSSASQYLHNMKVAMLQPVCDRKNEGIIASLPNAYNRAMGELAKRANESKLQQARKNEHYGTVGKREDFEVTITGAHGYVGSFGPGTVVTMLTDDGLTFVSFATGNAPSEQDVGKRMAFRGTIKAHTERKGVKQTVFNRCTWSENE